MADITAISTDLTSGSMDLLPPPAAVYDTREELLEAVKKHALSQGYRTAIKSGNPSRNVAIHLPPSSEVYI
ncbi:hypothetical protein N7527_012142 [Penicillium freii]|nr:hypothetical protein N7527_012142 [Penicillium freii]